MLKPLLALIAMTSHKFAIYPGLGEWAKENLHYSQAVRIGNIIKISGQGQIDSCFLYHNHKTNLNPSIQAAGTPPRT